MRLYCRFLDGIQQQSLYILLCFICRTMEANGASMMATASFAIMAKQFSKSVGSSLVSRCTASRYQTNDWLPFHLMKSMTMTHINIIVISLLH